MYSKDKLLHPDLPVLNAPEFKKLRSEIVIPDIQEFDRDSFKQQMVEHFKKNESNDLNGFDAFPHHDIILGCQQFIDNLISKQGLNGLQIFEHDYHYYKTLNPDIEYVTVDTLQPGKPVLIALPFPGHLQEHRQMNEILEVCNRKNIDVHVDCAWITSAFDIEFNFDQPCIKSFAMSFSKAYSLNWNKIGIRWSRELDKRDAITIQNKSGAISRFNMYVGQKYMEKFPIDYICKKHKDEAK